MILHAQRISPTTVKSPVRNPAKIADSWKSRTDETEQKIIHDLTAQSHFASDFLIQAEIKI